MWPPGGRLAGKVPSGHVPNYLYVRLKMKTGDQAKVSHRVYVDHIAIKKLRIEIADAILNTEEPEVILELCRSTNRRIMLHIEMEENALIASDIPKAEIKRHIDHHRLIVALLDNECHLIETGNTYAGTANHVFNEIMIKHEVLFDNVLTKYC